MAVPERSFRSASCAGSPDEHDPGRPRGLDRRQRHQYGHAQRGRQRRPLPEAAGGADAEPGPSQPDGQRADHEPDGSDQYRQRHQPAQHHGRGPERPVPAVADPAGCSAGRPRRDAAGRPPRGGPGRGCRRLRAVEPRRPCQGRDPRAFGACRRHARPRRARHRQPRLQLAGAGPARRCPVPLPRRRQCRPARRAGEPADARSRRGGQHGRQGTDARDPRQRQRRLRRRQGLQLPRPPPQSHSPRNHKDRP